LMMLSWHFHIQSISCAEHDSDWLEQDFDVSDNKLAV